MSNQPEINSKDQYALRNERMGIYDRLEKISNLTSCTYVSGYTPENILSCNDDKILSCLLADTLPRPDFWNDLDSRCESNGKKVWYVTDNVIDPDKYSDFKNIKIISYPRLISTNAQNDILAEPNPMPSRLYNCFMQRCDSVRQSWFYFLHLDGLLDKGYVSYLLFQLEEYSKLTGVDLFDFIHYNKGLDQLEKFNKSYQVLKSRVPYRNFPENFDLIKYINDSKYSVILETYAVEDASGRWCFTEKVMRSLQSNSINLIFAQKGSIKILEDLGLMIDKINQEWDNDEWIIRQKKILKALKEDRVCFDSISRKEISEHNRNLLNSWKKEYQRTDFFDSLAENIISS